MQNQAIPGCSRGGAVAIVQRFGAALNLNVHIHVLVIDGVFAPDGAGGVRFCPAEPMGAGDVASLFTTIERRIGKLLARRGVSDGGEGFDASDRYVDEAPTLAGLTDGTTHLVFEPVELLERLAALTPRPRINLADAGGADSRDGGDPAHPASSGPAGHGAGDAARARPSAAVRRRRRSPAERRLNPTARHDQPRDHVSTRGSAGGVPPAYPTHVSWAHRPWLTIVPSPHRVRESARR